MLLRRLLLLAGVLAVAAAIGAALAVRELGRRLDEPHRGYAAPHVFVDIEAGDATRAIGRRLAAAGVVRDELTFRAAVWRDGRGRELQAGEYRFDRPLSAMDVVDVIASGRVHLRPITFPEGLIIAEMADIFESAGFGTRDAFAAAAREVALVADLDGEAADLEGYLFPDTYALPRDATAGDLVRAMVAEFRRAFDADIRAAAGRRGLTVRETVTLASLIERETGSADEHALVSAVFANRLRIGMLLQTDPTVIYALRRDGLYDGNLTRANLRHDSPYNTYVYGGLPPGPIAAPGRAALAAVVAPADVSYLYFVSRNDGTHAFANTLREHNRNVREFQVEYFRRRRTGQ